MTLPMPPLVNTTQTPEDIIGPHQMETLRQHVNGYEERAARVTHKPSKLVAEMISRLNAHGYYIDGLDKHGNVCFRIALKGDVQREFEAGMPELEGLSMEELQHMARSGYRGMRSGGEFGKLKN